MKKSNLLTVVSLLLAACASSEVLAQPTVIATAMPSYPSLTPLLPPSQTSSATPLPTTVSEPDIAPACRIAGEGGQLYLLSDKEFNDLATTKGKLNRTLASHYPEWANYTQMVSWSTQPVTLGEIIVAASLDEESNVQINPAVILVVLGESSDWQLPSDTDLFLKAQGISAELNRLDLDWDKPQNESLRNQYPEVANSGTYALYIYFNSKLDRLQSWCNTYRQLFQTSP